MPKPWIHAKSSARKYGGLPEDYIEIHQLMDSSKAVMPDNRHRTLTHNSWFPFIVEKIFGLTKINSEGKEYSVRGVCEDHIKEDFGFIPTVSDYLQLMELADWMNNGTGEPPPSYRKLSVKGKNKIIHLD